jgi:signal transduction histidine kinase
MLGKLTIRRKLALSLAIPLIAIAFAMTANTAERVRVAQSRADTARIALAAREIGALIQSLQQERLLALGYLAAPSLNRSALLRQSQTVIDTTTRLAAQPETAAVLAQAKPALDQLAEARQRVAEGTMSGSAAYYVYRSADLALLDALGLGRQRAADADGFRALMALDALMRSNEEASSASAIIVGSAVDDGLDGALLTRTLIADEQHLTTFRQLGTLAEVTVADVVERGDAAGRVHRLALAMTDNQWRPSSSVEISDALTAALTYTSLRRLAQDRVARDVAQSAQEGASDTRFLAVLAALIATLLFLGVLALGIMVGRSIAVPLRRVTRAVSTVADLSSAELVRVADSDQLNEPPPELASVQVDSRDEIGELAGAVNRVQSAAAMLLERQATARANVATMFANVARRTQNLVDRQLQLINELEREVTDDALRNRVYQLDHVTSRLRRSADSLMVISGTVDPQLATTPTPLADVVSGALAEIEGYAGVEVGALPSVSVVADAAGDLRLVLAELLENATNFSPPGTMTQIAASMGRSLTIVVTDHGVGMSPARLAEENQRLVERERLDIAPTRVLGLFVVGRLARRHGLTVRLEPSPGRGVTATVEVPIRLVTPDFVAQPTRREPAVAAVAASLVPATAIEAIAAATRSGPFPWLTARSSTATKEPTVGEDAPAAGATAVGVAAVPGAGGNGAGGNGTPPVTPAGLRQRVPGAHLIDDASTVDLAPPPRLVRDPERERAALDDYLSGLARAATVARADRAGAGTVTAGEPGPSVGQPGTGSGAPGLDGGEPSTNGGEPSTNGGEPSPSVGEPGAVAHGPGPATWSEPTSTVDLGAAPAQAGAEPTAPLPVVDTSTDLPGLAERGQPEPITPAERNP